MLCSLELMLVAYRDWSPKEVPESKVLRMLVASEVHLRAAMNYGWPLEGRD
jgi:hypothetical protein